MEEIYWSIIKWFGKKAQVIKACEELAELIKALCKWQNGQGDKENIAEEIADVQVMIEQLILIFGIEKRDLTLIRSEKIERTRERMLKEVNHTVMGDSDGDR